MLFPLPSVRDSGVRTVCPGLNDLVPTSGTGDGEPERDRGSTVSLTYRRSRRGPRHGVVTVPRGLPMSSR